MKSLISSILLLFAFTVKSQTLDLSYIGASSFNVMAAESQSIAQSFQPTVSGKFHSVKLDLEAPYCVDNINLAIRFELREGNGIGGPLLDSITMNIPLPMPRQLMPVSFPLQPSICAGNNYTIVAIVPTQPFCDIGASQYPTALWFTPNSDIVPNGDLYVNGTQMPGEDAYFETYYIDAYSASYTKIDVSCSGGSDGSIDVTVSGGIAPYTYLWTPIAYTTEDISNISSNSYSVSITDNTGCTTAISNINIFELSSPIFISPLSTTNPTCYGGGNGEIQIDVTGGTPPYGFTWSNFSTSQNQVGLFSGSYDVTVNDNNGCPATQNFVLTDPTQISITFSETIPTCPGFSDGEINATVSEGFPPYTYMWNPGSQTSSTLSGVVAGTYTLEITDANGCFFSDNFTLNDPVFYIQTANMVVQPETCQQSNGSITGIYAVAANTPVTYVWSAPHSNNDLFNVPGGNYTLTATDNTGCVATENVNVPSLGFALSLSQSSSPATCLGICDGSATVSANGGTPPYSYVWSDGQTGSSVSGLCANTHTVTVTDVNGCSRSTDIGIGQPGAFNVTSSFTEASCGASDGAISLTVVAGGTPPHSFVWTNGVSGSSLSGVPAGSYGVTITDANNCQNYRVFSLNSASGPTVSNVLTNPTCFGSSNGSIDQTISGGTAPINILWSTGHTGPDLNAVPEGVYDVEISDASGCVLHFAYELFAPSPIEISPSLTLPPCGVPAGGITLNTSGGTAPYSYTWSANAGGAVTPSISPVSAGIYTVNITDANGCTFSQSIGLSNDNGPTISTDALVQPSCQNNDGAIFITASGVPGPFNYFWSGLPYPQNSEADQTNLAPGIYDLSVYAPGGCQSHQSYQLTGSNLNPQEICLITVDSITNKNVVVWEKTAGLGIAEYELYRETSVPNTYLKIATVPFNDLSSYDDDVASTSAHAWKYKLVTIDSCGIASSFIASHKTIHLNTQLISGGSEAQLNWDQYIGFAYNEFNVLRNHNGQGWTIIATVPSTQFLYIDSNLPVNGTIDYAVEAVPLTPCVATRATNHNSTRSNRGTVAAPVSVEENTLLQNIRVYPNPTPGIVSIEGLYLQQEEISIEILDMTGRKVFSMAGNPTNGTLRIDLSSFENGMYSIRILTSSGSTTKSLVLQK